MSEHHRAGEEHSWRPERAGWAPVVIAVMRRPGLWPTAFVQVRRLARAGWWYRWPLLPIPDAEWLRFRARTAYGDADRRPEPADVVAWLEWCRDGV